MANCECHNQRGSETNYMGTLCQTLPHVTPFGRSQSAHPNCGGELQVHTAGSCRPTWVCQKDGWKVQLTGAFYAGNGWVAGGCWDDY